MQRQLVTASNWHANVRHRLKFYYTPCRLRAMPHDASMPRFHATTRRMPRCTVRYGKAINQVEFTGKPNENCQSPGRDGRPDGGKGNGSSKHIKCGILNAKLSTTTAKTITKWRIGCPLDVATFSSSSSSLSMLLQAACQTLDGDTLKVIELSEMLSLLPLFLLPSHR